MVAEIVFNRNRNFSGVKPLAKELMKLQKETWSNGQVRIECPDEQNIFEVDLIITPNDGLYFGAEIRFKFEFRDYPSNTPHITCETKVLHPNISAEDNDICLNILDGAVASLEDYAHALLWLLNNPALDDPLFSFDYEDFEDYQRQLRESIVGGVDISNCWFDGCLRAGVTPDMVRSRPFITDGDIAPDLDASMIPEEEEDDGHALAHPAPAPAPIARADSKVSPNELVCSNSAGTVSQLVNFFEGLNTGRNV